MSKSPGAQPARIYPLHDSDSAEDLDWYLTVALTFSTPVAAPGCAEKHFAKCGFCNLIGVDLTQAMLDVAHQKQIYRQLQIVDLTQPLPFPDAGFDVIRVVCHQGIPIPMCNRLPSSFGDFRIAGQDVAPFLMVLTIIPVGNACACGDFVCLEGDPHYRLVSTSSPNGLHLFASILDKLELRGGPMTGALCVVH